MRQQRMSGSCFDLCQWALWQVRQCVRAAVSTSVSCTASFLTSCSQRWRNGAWGWRVQEMSGLLQPGRCYCWPQSTQHCGCLKNQTIDTLVLWFLAKCFSKNEFTFSWPWNTESWLQFSLGGAQLNKHNSLLTYSINSISSSQFFQSQDCSRQTTRWGAEAWTSREKVSHKYHDWAFLQRRLALSSGGGHCGYVASEFSWLLCLPSWSLTCN